MSARQQCSWLFVLAFIVSVPFSAFAQSAATLSVDSVTAEPAQTVSVNVKAQDILDEIVGIQGSFSFDPGVFMVTELTFNESFKVTSKNIQNDQGLVRFVGTLVMDTAAPIGFTDDVTLFTFQAQAVGSPGAVSPIDLTFDLVKNMEHEVLIVTVIDGTFTITDVTTNLPPIPDFTPTPQAPQVNEKVSFIDASSDPDGFIVNWFWDFGDGATLEVQTPPSEPVMHTYLQGGAYNVTLTVTDNRGASASVTKAVRVGPKHGGPLIYVYPNPCRTLCNFYYEFPPDAISASLRIFNIRGELVFSTELDVNTNIFRWNLHNDFGQPVPNGPYFFFATFTTSQGVGRTPVDVLVVQR